jgi:hypothetical protein
VFRYYEVVPVLVQYPKLLTI